MGMGDELRLSHGDKTWCMGGIYIICYMYEYEAQYWVGVSMVERIWKKMGKRVALVAVTQAAAVTRQREEPVRKNA